MNQLVIITNKMTSPHTASWSTTWEEHWIDDFLITKRIAIPEWERKTKKNRAASSHGRNGCRSSIGSITVVRVSTNMTIKIKDRSVRSIRSHWEKIVTHSRIIQRKLKNIIQLKSSARILRNSTGCGVGGDRLTRTWSFTNMPIDRIRVVVVSR